MSELMFEEITFNSIYIDKATNLSLIHTNAFNSLNLTLKEFIFKDTPLRNNDSNYDIFTALSHMVNIESVNMHNTIIIELPDWAYDGQQLL